MKAHFARHITSLIMTVVVVLSPNSGFCQELSDAETEEEVVLCAVETVAVAKIPVLNNPDKTSGATEPLPPNDRADCRQGTIVPPTVRQSLNILFCIFRE